MSSIVTRRDYHLTRFRIEKYLAKGFEELSPEEIRDLKELSREMSLYEQKHFPAPAKQQQLHNGEEPGWSELM